MKLKLNCYPVIPKMEEKIEAAVREAYEKGAKELEIAYGDASANVKKRILHVLNKKELRVLYKRMEKTESGWGRVYLYF